MSSQKRSRTQFENDRPPAQAPYALYGTPLPAFDPEVRDDGSYVPIWKQEVTDERGRKRLHGAFTGGWSAGYFNTVGSKEGWTPSTFVSSRANRAKLDEKQKAEDFMDDEDLAEQAESQQLETHDIFAGLGSSDTGGKSRGMFSDLFRTTEESMGTKLLQRMGWREGQGIGARISRRAQGDHTGDGHMFAPEDSRMIKLVRKTDRKGLGFAGETNLSNTTPASVDEDSDVDARIFSSRRSKVISKPTKAKKSSIGVGVLNDTGSDDEDAYAIGPTIQYNRIIGGDKAKRKGGLISSSSSTKVITKKLAQRSANVTASFRRCHDGRLPLEGYILTTKPILILLENQYPPADVPPGWQPPRISLTTLTNAYQSTADAAKASILDARGRANLLGEQQLPGKSVFDFLKPEARDKLAAASGKDNLPQAGGEGRPEGFADSEKRTLWDAVPRIDKETAIAALQRGSRGWMPYSEDEAKRERYRAFIMLQAGISSGLPLRPTGFSTDDWTREMKEFAQAAEVFKPVSGLMASRFTTSSSSPQIASDRPDATPAMLEKPRDPAEEAAQAGMYGPLTRSRLVFRPTRLLCKRFNIKPPAHVEVDPEAGETETTATLINKATIDNMMMHATFTRPVDASATMHVHAERNDALEKSKAEEAILKSVFEDD